MFTKQNESESFHNFSLKKSHFKLLVFIKLRIYKTNINMKKFGCCACVN